MMCWYESFKAMSIWHKSVRGALLGLMILLAGVAPLLTVAVDNDDDDDTPPITVEMNLAAPSRKATQTPAAEIAQQFTAVGKGEPFNKAALSSQHHPMIQPVTGSPQLVVPLRT
jgi:hypothetical protein